MHANENPNKYSEGTEVAFYSIGNGIVAGKVVKYDEKAGTYAVRIVVNGQMAQVRGDSCYAPEDVMKFADMDSEQGISEAKEYVNAFRESANKTAKKADGAEEAPKTTDNPHGVQIIENTKNFKDYAFEVLAFAFVVSICVLFLWIGWAFESEPVPEPPKPKTETEILAEELNRLNSESIPDAGACARNEARNARKSEILKKLNYFK